MPSVADSWAFAQVQAHGYRFQGSEHYGSDDWLTFEFPDKPSKLYILKLKGRWSEAAYTRVRLVDTGGFDWWYGGVDTWHSKVIFLPVSEGVPAVEINFSSMGWQLRGPGELFDYAKTEVRRARQLHEQSYGDPRWYTLSHTANLNAPLSYRDIVNVVAASAVDYPYFTWDESGTYQDCVGRGAAGG